eukprot:gene2731-5379_t
MWTNLQNYTNGIRDFCWKHRTKLAIGAVFIGGAVAYYEVSRLPVESEIEVDRSKEKKPFKRRNIDNATRVSILCRIRKENESAMKYFLSTFRSKLNEVIDVSSLIRSLKDLRDNQNLPNKSDLEAELWENIKVSAFTIVFVSSYLLSTLSVLLLVQLHMLGSHSPSISVATDNTTNTSTESNIPSSSGHLIDIFPAIISKSYKRLLNDGLLQLSQSVREKVQYHLQDWKVQQKLEVDFHELIQMMVVIRRDIEADLDGLIRQLVLSEECVSGVPEEKDGGEYKDNDVRNEQHTESSGDVDADVDLLMRQTWDIVELPMFRASIAEAMECCFEHIFLDLRRNVFAPGNPAGHVSMQTPPLAALLPKMKAVASRLTDAETSAGTHPQPVWRALASGVQLEELCEGIFDSLANANS